MGFFAFTELRKGVFSLLSGLFMMMLGVGIFALYVFPAFSHESDLLKSPPEFIRDIMVFCVFYISWGPVVLLGHLGASDNFLKGFANFYHTGMELTFPGWLYVIFFWFALSWLLSWPANLKRDKDRRQ